MSSSTMPKRAAVISLSLPFPSVSAMLVFTYPTTMISASWGHCVMFPAIRFMDEASSRARYHPTTNRYSSSITSCNLMTFRPC